MPKPKSKPRWDRLILSMPPELRKMLDACVPEGQPRAEWIRQAIRERLLRDGRSTDPSYSCTGDP